MAGLGVVFRRMGSFQLGELLAATGMEPVGGPMRRDKRLREGSRVTSRHQE